MKLKREPPIRRFANAHGLPSDGVPMRVPIIGAPPAPPKQQVGIHRYHVSAAIERDGMAPTFESSIMNAERPLMNTADFAVVATWFAEEFSKKHLDSPPPSKVTLIAYTKIAFIPLEEIERARQHAEAEAQLAGPDGKPAQKPAFEP